VPGEVVATSAGAPGTRQRRPEAKSWRQHHGCRRGGTSGDLRGKQRVGRRRGGGCGAVGGDGATGRRSGEAGEAAGGGRRQGRERRTAGRGAAAVGELGKGLKRENARRGLHFIGWGREPATGGAGTSTGMAAGGNGWWPDLARPFPRIEDTIQGEIKGELKRIQWGLISPI
jgi:hypothetical protein